MKTYIIRWLATYFGDGKEIPIIVESDSFLGARKQIRKLCPDMGFKFVPENPEHFKLLEQNGSDYIVTAQP